MPKKRKTRSQKERLAERRKAKPTFKKEAQNRGDSLPTESHQETTVQEAHVKPRANLGLKKSLALLMFLVSIQLVVWIYFRISGADESIGNLIRL